MLRRISTLLYLSFFFSLAAFSQEKKSISLEDVWAKPTFRVQYMAGFEWMADEASYTALVENKIIQFDLLSASPKKTIFSNADISIDEYEFNETEDKLLITSETEGIYRNSFKAIYYLYDLKSQKLTKLNEQKISYATFSPDGLKIAYVRDNNLFYFNLQTSKEVQVTNTGKTNFIINGSTDWVYEEEFSFTKAFSWAPDSKKIAYYSFDESEVKEYNLQLWNDGLYPTDYRYKYPKAGEKNSVVTIHCYYMDSGKHQKINTGEEKDIYIPRMQWTKHNDIISIQRLNRLQNNFEILHANIATNEIKKVYKETNNSYVEITDDLTYLKNGSHFIITSEKDGYKHIYRYDMTGKQLNQITKGNWEVDKFLGIDEKGGRVFYTSTQESPLERHFYSSDLSGKKQKKLTDKKGTHEIEMSPGFNYFIDVFSTLNTPPVYTLNTALNGAQKKVLQNNDKLNRTFEEYQISQGEFFKFTTEENVSLNGYMIKPLKFDASKKYPVLLFIYGGPGHQGVTDSWKGANYLWFQMLAQQGYIIVSIDNRGTGGRGADFKKLTQNQLGKYETLDVIETAKYLGKQSFVDPSRIGIFGWSFGGYLSTLAMTLGADYFKAGIAVAPVISWRFYDTIYTERYLGLPQQNAKGYDDNSPLSHAEKLKGNYLLIHGTADDNVHVQNSYAMQDALIKANKQFQAFYYPDKNHGIYGGITRYHLYKMMTDFIYTDL